MSKKCCCCKPGCAACESEDWADVDLQAVVSNTQTGPGVFGSNPYDNPCDCDATPYPSMCCDFLDGTIPLSATPGGVVSPCAFLSYLYAPLECTEEYLGGYYQLEALPDGLECDKYRQCCVGGYLEMDCTKTGGAYVDQGTWYGIGFTFCRIYTDATTWHLGAIVYLTPLMAGAINEPHYYQFIEFTGQQQIDCADLSLEFDDLQIVPCTGVELESGSGLLGYQYCIPDTITIERI